MIKVNAAKQKAAADRQRLDELKAKLNETDFKVLPDYDKPIGDLKAQRQAWRDEVRKLEDELGGKV